MFAITIFNRRVELMYLTKVIRSFSLNQELTGCTLLKGGSKHCKQQLVTLGIPVSALTYEPYGIGEKSEAVQQRIWHTALNACQDNVNCTVTQV